MVRRLVQAIAAALALVSASPAYAADTAPLFNAPALSDSELAGQRGGFELPGGIDVALAATVTTSVNGAPVLTTTFKIVGNTATVATDGVLATVTAAAPDSVAAVKSATASAPTITVTLGKTAAADSAPTPAAAPASGSSLDPAKAMVTTVLTAPGELASTASLDGLQVTHFVGDRIGAMVANSGDGRIIDQSLTLDISLANAGPFMIGSTLARVQNVGIEASMLRGAGG
ncbi:MAG TPA: hypothetical protein VFT56_09495 [Sphingomonas sp.]|nr:hypothetical protein [Sphingomonas sp.]